MPPDPLNSATVADATDPDDALARAVHHALVYDGGPGAHPPAPVPRADVADAVRRRAPVADAAAVDDAVDQVMARMTGLGPLEALLADPDVSDVMVNGPGPVWVERRGQLEATTVVLDRATIEHLVERVVGPLGLRADRSSPLVDARLPDGSRAHVVMPPVAVDGPVVTIRRFAARPVALVAMSHVDVASLLAWAVRSRLNIVVSGGTGAGKTTLLNSLAGEISPAERVVTVEEAAELRLAHHHVVRLEARPASPEGASGITIRQLVRNALRMRPDRIIVGECRGAEALEMLVAANSGHEGSLSTCHANSPADALRRLETMVLLADAALPLDAVREQVSAAVDLLIQVARRPYGRRRVVSVAEVVGPASDVRSIGGRHGAPTCRLLGDERGLWALPSRPARTGDGRPADPEWLTRSASEDEK
ncbi:MAG: CpaF family protein [Acidimicrobiales bacterium]